MKYNKSFIVLLNSLIYNIVFNIPILAQRFLDYHLISKNALTASFFEFLFAVGYVFPFLYALSSSNFISRILLVFIYIISGISSYFVYHLHLTINNEIIASFFETNRSELLNFLSLDLILAVISSIALAFFTIASYKCARFIVEQNKRLVFITSVFILGALFGDGDWMNNILPYNVTKESGIYFFEKFKLVEKRLDLAKDFEYQIDEQQTEDLNVVLIIGESARGDHFSLSNYHRKTNPILAEDKSLIYYPNVTACYPLTRVAVPCMLTRATRANQKISAKETSFIGIFKKLGFYTTWIGMQGTYTVIDAPYFDLAKEANKALLLGTDVELFKGDDSALYSFITQFFNDHPKGKNLLILHTYGSHFHYEDRYTDEFRVFNPICPKKGFLPSMDLCKLDQRINSYDNSILFTDDFINRVIKAVSNKKALLIYTPDHGESLGEDGRFFHGTYNNGEQVAVNMMFWPSNLYQKTFPNFVKALQDKKDQQILHDHLFHSILGCSGIKSSIIEKNLNLCN